MPEESIIIATIGADDANCYLTLDDADAYFALRYPSTEWDAATDSVKERALITATRQIDCLTFKYLKANPLSPELQALSFPRTGSATHERHIFTDSDGNYIIPADIVAAVCEQAFHLIKMGASSSVLSELKAQGVQSHSIGDVSVSFGGDVSTSSKTKSEQIFANESLKYLSTWLDRTMRVERG